VNDLADPLVLREALDDVCRDCGAVDILVNNAGAAVASSLGTMNPQAWKQDIELNLNAAYHCVEAALPAMLARGQGTIVNIATVNALQTLGHPAYSAAKAGLLSYTRALAVEYGPRGIRANAICPGTVKTPAWQQRAEKNPAIFDELKKWYPLRQFAEPRDIAQAVAFLACDAAQMITGAVLTVAAGLTAGNPVLASELTLETF